MSKITLEEAKTFPEGGGMSEFLSLKDDGDSVTVRFLYEKINDIPVYLIHDVPIEGETSSFKTKTIGCLRHTFSEPESACPLCAKGIKQKKVVYLNVLNEETGKVMIWQRSEGFFSKTMTPYLGEYEETGIYNTPFKIKRNGARNDRNTTYALIPLPVKVVDKKILDEIIDVEEKGIVKQISKDGLEVIARQGYYSDTQSSEPTPTMQRPAYELRERGMIGSYSMPDNAGF